MSPFLLKIYGFLVIVTLLISNSLFQQKRSTFDIVAQEKTSTSTPEISREVMPSLGDITQTTSSNAVPENEVQTIEPGSDYEMGAPQANPCSSPIVYTLGTFDTRFNISKSNFLEIVSESAELWSNAHEGALFTYSEKATPGVLTVNLIYDDRQAKTDQNKLLGAEIRNTESGADTVKKEYKDLQEIFNVLKADYTKEVENFASQQKKYNETVASWNEKGGAPKAEFEALKVEKETMQKMVDELNKKHAELTTMLTEINAKIARYNELVNYANTKIQENNTTSKKKFTEGEYVSGSNSITIYQFSDEVKLKRVLTHEFGHALGIDHTKSKQSIMYAVNTATNTSLTDEDMAALKNVCNK
jgi:predicted Zn-dependent protease